MTPQTILKQQSLTIACLVLLVQSVVALTHPLSCIAKQQTVSVAKHDESSFDWFPPEVWGDEGKSHLGGFHLAMGGVYVRADNPATIEEQAISFERSGQIEMAVAAYAEAAVRFGYADNVQSAKRCAEIAVKLSKNLTKEYQDDLAHYFALRLGQSPERMFSFHDVDPLEPIMVAAIAIKQRLGEDDFAFEYNAIAELAFAYQPSSVHVTGMISNDAIAARHLTDRYHEQAMRLSKQAAALIVRSQTGSINSRFELAKFIEHHPGINTCVGLPNDGKDIAGDLLKSVITETGSKYGATSWHLLQPLGELRWNQFLLHLPEQNATRKNMVAIAQAQAPQSPEGTVAARVCLEQIYGYCTKGELHELLDTAWRLAPGVALSDSEFRSGYSICQ